jgi:hypothetical protein
MNVWFSSSFGPMLVHKLPRGSGRTAYQLSVVPNNHLHSSKCGHIIKQCALSSMKVGLKNFQCFKNRTRWFQCYSRYWIPDSGLLRKWGSGISFWQFIYMWCNKNPKKKCIFREIANTLITLITLTRCPQDSSMSVFKGYSTTCIKKWVFNVKFSTKNNI